MYKDHYVVLDKTDFENADAKKTKTIEIVSFAKLDEVDPILYEQPYYLEPDKSGDKAYAILREALAATGKVGVATFVLRNKEGLALLNPSKKVIMLNRIRFAEEIRSTKDLKLPDVSRSKTKEHDMAVKLIAQLTEKFDIDKYKDTYTGSLMKIIAAKAKGGKKAAPKKMKIVHTKKSDLMSVLEASLSASPRKKVS
jgi:DNA end-binding protein Ku